MPVSTSFPPPFIFPPCPPRIPRRGARRSHSLSFFPFLIQHLTRNINVPNHLANLKNGKNRLMNKVHPGSVFRVDKRRDGVVRASNITKFLAACSSKLGLPSEDLFFIDDLNEGSPESLARVSRTIIALVEPSENPPLDPRSFKTREPYRQLRSRGDVPPPPPRSPHRSRLSYDRNHEIPPFPSGMGSSSQVDLSDASSILSDTTTFSSLLDTGRSFARNLRSAKGGGSSIITTATTATSYSSHSHREATPSIPSPNFEYPRGKKRSRSDSRSPGSLGSGLGETAGVDLNRVAEETEGGGSGTVDKFGLRGNSSSKDRTGRSQYLGNGKWPDDFFSPSSLSSGSGLSKSLRPIIPSENTPARKLVPRHRNLLENGTLRLTLTVGEEGKPVTRFVSTCVFLPVSFRLRIPHAMILCGHDSASPHAVVVLTCPRSLFSDTLGFRSSNSETALVEDSSERYTKH